MAALPPIDYQVLAQTLLATVAAAGGAAGAVAGGGGAAPAAATTQLSGDRMDIERTESSMKKFLSENCVDTNATVLQNIRTFLDHVSNVFKDQVVIYETRDDMERMAGTTTRRPSLPQRDRVFMGVRARVSRCSLQRRPRRDGEEAHLGFEWLRAALV